jgi:hypothetical protein
MQLQKRKKVTQEQNSGKRAALTVSNLELTSPSSTQGKIFLFLTE